MQVTGADGAPFAAPFRLGLSVFGAITLFLAGLIRTSRFYWPATRRLWSTDAAAAKLAYRWYIAANIAYLALLAAGVVRIQHHIHKL